MRDPEAWSSKRRIDPMDIVVYGVAGFAVFYIIKKIGEIGDTAKKKFDEAVDATKEAAKTVATFGFDDVLAIGISRIITKYTISGPLHIPGGVVFKDGSYISWDAIINDGSQLSSNNTFAWKGIRYKVIGRRKDGNYGAVLA